MKWSEGRSISPLWKTIQISQKILQFCATRNIRVKRYWKTGGASTTLVVAMVLQKTSCRSQGHLWYCHKIYSLNSYPSMQLEIIQIKNRYIRSFGRIKDIIIRNLPTFNGFSIVKWWEKVQTSNTMRFRNPAKFYIWCFLAKGHKLVLGCPSDVFETIDTLFEKELEKIQDRGHIQSKVIV